MRILVVSDSHGNDAALRRALLSQPKAEVVIHLGDGEEELQRARGSFPEKAPPCPRRGSTPWTG